MERDMLSREIGYVRSDYEGDVSWSSSIGRAFKRLTTSLIFPLKSKPLNIKGGYFQKYDFAAAEGSNMATFKAGRDNGKRLHAARDLYTEPYSDVVAMADGKVLDARPFYMKTDQVTIVHDYSIVGGSNLIIRYGELAPNSITVRPGDFVKQGQVIGKTGKLLNNYNKPLLVIDGKVVYMLHLEAYTGEKGVNLSKHRLSIESGKFRRRNDLIDPIDILLTSYKNSFGGDYEFEEDEFSFGSLYDSIAKPFSGITNVVSDTVKKTNKPASFGTFQIAIYKGLANYFVEKGENNPNSITDQIFYSLHPDMKERRLEKGSDLATEWVEIKNKVVLPVLSKESFNPPLKNEKGAMTISQQYSGKNLIVSKKSIEFIIAHEITDERSYNKKDKFPTVPGEKSGVTIGIGYDLGQGVDSIEEFVTDWSGFIDTTSIERLKIAVLKNTVESIKVLPLIKDIVIPFEAAIQVFYKVTLPKYARKTLRAFPNIESLNPDAQGAILSIVFNRGPSMENIPRRREMIEIRDLVKSKNYALIAKSIRSMKRLWRNRTDKKTGSPIKDNIGLITRREDEAKLLENSNRTYDARELIRLG